MSDWYVFQHDATALGPWSTEAVADAILTGKLPPDIWVASPGGQRWVRALEVPVIASIVEGIPTRQRRFDSGMRRIAGETLQELPSTIKPLRDTVEMTSLPAMSVRLPPESDDEEVVAASETRPPKAADSPQPSTARRVPLPPPSTPTPTPRRVKAAG